MLLRFAQFEANRISLCGNAAKFHVCRKANISHPAKAGYFTYRDRLFRPNQSVLRTIFFRSSEAAFSLLEISGVKQNDPPWLGGQERIRRKKPRGYCREALLMYSRLSPHDKACVPRRLLSKGGFHPYQNRSEKKERGEKTERREVIRVRLGITDPGSSRLNAVS